MSREAVLLQWERKIQAAERRDGNRFARSSDNEKASVAEHSVPSEAVTLRPAEDATKPRRFERRASAPPPAVSTPLAGVGTESIPARQPAAERRTITITGQPTPARRRRSVVDAQLAQPDRIALWAFLLGLFLVAVAAGTAHA